MKKTGSLLVALILIVCNTKAQDTLYVHQKDGALIKIAISAIDSIVFTASDVAEPSDTSVVDKDGNIYTIVGIGTQKWMGQNLKTTTLKNGDPIPHVRDDIAWSGLSSPAYCWYENDSLENKESYGALYNWFTVASGNVCPEGWHVPDEEDWTTLVTQLGGESVAGGKLKETGPSHWEDPNEGASNITTFTALPGGVRWYNGGFVYLGTRGTWWSSTGYGTCCALYFNLQSDTEAAVLYDLEREGGSYVRCIKD